MKLVIITLLAVCAYGQITQVPPPSGGGGGTGTVTSVDTGCGASGGAITATGTIIVSEVVNAQTGTSYTVLDGDCGKLLSFSNASPIAGSLPQANGSTFISGWFVDVQNRGAGTVTITPTTSTIDGAASLTLLTSDGVRIVSDGTNYFTERGRQRVLLSGDIPNNAANTSGSAATLTTSRSIYGNNFNGSAALAQIIASTFGGTGNGFFKVIGPASSEKSWTVPNQSIDWTARSGIPKLTAGVPSDAVASDIPQSGTSGGIPYYSSSSAIGSSAAWTVNTVMKGGGAGSSPTVSGCTIDSNDMLSCPGGFSGGDGTVAGEYKMTELTANGSNYRSFFAPDLLTADLRMKFPDTVPSAGDVLTFGAPSSSISTMAFTSSSGSGNFARVTSPTFVTPGLGAATATTINKVTITAPASAATLTVVDGGSLITAGAFATTITSTATTNSTLPAGTHSLAPLDSPSFTTPTLGAATATTVNKYTFTAPASGATLTIADGKVLTASNTLTLTGTDSSSVAFGAGGTVLYNTSQISEWGSNAQGATPTLSTTSYIAPSSTAFSGTIAVRQWPVTSDGHLKYFYFTTNGTQNNSGSMVCSVYVNGSASALSITVAASDTLQTYTDLVNSVAVSRGDKIAVGCLNNATSAGAAVAGWGFGLYI